MSDLKQLDREANSAVRRLKGEVGWVKVLFVWLVHRPNTETRRYKKTRTILFPDTINGAISWLWRYQNYHSAHHRSARAVSQQ